LLSTFLSTHWEGEVWRKRGRRERRKRRRKRRRRKRRRRRRRRRMLEASHGS
jgi:hypothetical protein